MFDHYLHVKKKKVEKKSRILYEAIQLNVLDLMARNDYCCCFFFLKIDFMSYKKLVSNIAEHLQMYGHLLETGYIVA